MRHLKQEFDKLSIREVIVYTIAAIGQIAMIVLVYLSLFLEPKGEIHSSVLYCYGIECGFTGALLGISQFCFSEIRNFKANITDFLKDNANETDS